jgi:uncharacterized protein YegP (UPF0339 family)
MTTVDLDGYYAEVWQTSDHWYWHLRSGNHQVTDGGMQRYSRKDSAKRAIRRKYGREIPIRDLSKG